MVDPDKIEIVNIVATTKISDHLDLELIGEKIERAEFDPDRFPGLVYRLEKPKSALLLFRSGKANCTGARDVESVKQALQHVVSELDSAGIPVIKNPEITIQNMVATYDLGVELRLNAIAIGLGLENVEYEPEQFPGLVFRVEDPKAVMLLFSSGKVVITGVNDPAHLAVAIEKLTEELQKAELL
jgi:transcription initiation factor TFIID TATA-box-binding protein